MSGTKSVLVRVTIGDNLTCSFPDGNVVGSLKGRVRFENFTMIGAEVRFENGERFQVNSDEAVLFEVEKLNGVGEHPFTVHEVKDSGEVDETIQGGGEIFIDA